MGGEREGASGGQAIHTEQGGGKGDLFESPQNARAPPRVVHALPTRVQEVVRPATAPASTSGQASFGGLGVDEPTSSLGSADWEDFFRCAGGMGRGVGGTTVGQRSGGGTGQQKEM